MASLEHIQGHQPGSFCVHPAVLDCSTHTAAALAGPDDDDSKDTGAADPLQIALCAGLWRPAQALISTNGPPFLNGTKRRAGADPNGSVLVIMSLAIKRITIT